MSSHTRPYYHGCFTFTSRTKLEVVANVRFCRRRILFDSKPSITSPSKFSDAINRMEDDLCGNYNPPLHLSPEKNRPHPTRFNVMSALNLSGSCLALVLCYSLLFKCQTDIDDAKKFVSVYNKHVALALYCTI